jgi:cholesterol oxidase
MNNQLSTEKEYDFVVIGSGFGGSVSALRLSEKGYKVLVVEKGKRHKSADFPHTNWNLKKWLWLPSLRFFGFFKLTFLRHVSIISGVGYGGGSLVYANTLARPKDEFFNSGNWAGLCNWKNDLEIHYQTAEKMLGAALNPKFFDSDNALKKLAESIGRGNQFEATRVAVFFGEPEKTVEDPFFGGEGPERAGCKHCGACMTGCRHNAKNTLDKNYLHFAEKKGIDVLIEKQVGSVIPIGSNDGSNGYILTYHSSSSFLFKKKYRVKTNGVIFSGGVLGTVRLLLDMKNKCLPNISNQVGKNIRTNNESLIFVSSTNSGKNYSEGIAIGSIFPVDDDSHLEPVRYGSGSGFWKILDVPLTHGKNVFSRLFSLIFQLLKSPITYLKVYFAKDFAKRTVILLFMQHIDSTLHFKRGLFNLKTKLADGASPTAFMPLSKKLADKTAELINGKPMVVITEALTGIPSTAHILGGAVIGKTPETGVIDINHKVFGYQNMYVCDGSAVSANPGVNPSLTITAMAERAMSFIPYKQ